MFQETPVGIKKLDAMKSCINPVEPSIYSDPESHAYLQMVKDLKKMIGKCLLSKTIAPVVRK